MTTILNEMYADKIKQTIAFVVLEDSSNAINQLRELYHLLLDSKDIIEKED